MGKIFADACWSIDMSSPRWGKDSVDDSAFQGLTAAKVAKMKERRRMRDEEKWREALAPQILCQIVVDSKGASSSNCMGAYLEHRCIGAMGQDR